MKVAINAMLIAWLLAAATGCAGKSQRSNTPEPALGLSHEGNGGPLIDITAAPIIVEPTREITASRQPWKFGDADGVVIVTPNYRLFTTVNETRFLDQLPVLYERALAHYTSAIVKLPQPTLPLETFLFRSRAQWQAKTAEMLPGQAEIFSSLGRGGFTTRGTSVLYYIDRYGYPSDTFAIAAHEGWHQYTQQTFKQQLPIWLEEGIATYMEGYSRDPDGIPQFNPLTNFERWRTLRETVQEGRLIPLTELLTRSPQSFLSSSKDSLLMYYAQVWGLTRFLVEGEDGRYRQALSRVLIDAAEGRLISRMLNATGGNGGRPVNPRRFSMATRAGPAVVQEYFNSDLTAFEAQYRAYVENLIDQPPPRRGRRGPGS